MMYGPSYQYAAVMERVIDGDTYEMTVDLGFNIFHRIHVRLKDFDTAEIRSSSAEEKLHAQAASAFVKQLIPVGTKVTLATVKSAVYNRWEATVWYIDLKTAAQLSLKDVLDMNGFGKLATYA
jgi:micrococcal nuclease